MSTAAEVEHRNQDATAYVGNLDDAVTEELIWELCLQAGPVTSVHMPKDKVTGSTQGYGFVEFRTENDADYAVTVLNMIKLYGKPIRVNKSSQDRKSNDVGANLFIGNLDDSVDEKLLYDTFSAFGGITNTPKIMRDLETGNSKGFGFVSYDSFEASDLAIECMNGQFLCNKAISVGYAYKKESKGERHGSQAERLLAASRPEALKPHTMFAAAAGGPGGVGGGIGGAAVRSQLHPAKAAGDEVGRNQPDHEGRRGVDKSKRVQAHEAYSTRHAQEDVPTGGAQTSILRALAAHTATCGVGGGRVARCETTGRDYAGQTGPEPDVPLQG